MDRITIIYNVKIIKKVFMLLMKKATGDDEDEEKQKLESKSDYARAFQMFKDGRPLTEVAIELDIESPTVICYYEDYLKLVNMARLVAIYNDVKGGLPLFLQLYGRIKKERLSKPRIVELLKTPNHLLDLKEKVELYNDHLWNLHSKKEQMEKELEEKKKRLLV